jgi:hypothetical protein
VAVVSTRFALPSEVSQLPNLISGPPVPTFCIVPRGTVRANYKSDMTGRSRDRDSFLKPRKPSCDPRQWFP